MAELHRCPTPPKLTANDFNDIADIGLNRIAQLGSMFRALVETTEPESHPHHLAKIGAYLSEEWHFALDMSRAETLDRLNVPRAINRMTDRR
ncbi:hypothetical protein [Andreprevotia chitinilytica]|uniref:hypothetical protein n=1 Tax=Andreprevotia chitinilytica TaxID=396808 RepID=UPI000555E57F|nr:hypothetical protein [Andreprevotia chitinilytica]